MNEEKGQQKPIRISDMTLAQQIFYLRQTGLGVPRRIDIDLTIAETDREYAVSGNMMYIIAAPGADEYIDVRFNELREAQHRLFQQMGFITPFDKMYITTPAAQAGTLTIVYGSQAPELLQMIDNRSATSLDLAAIRDELRGDVAPENWGTEKTVGNAAAVEMINTNADRKGCIIQSKAVNTGIVYIGFDNTVATNKWIAELSAGMSITFDDYRGDLWARADAAGQLVGWGEW